MKTLSQQDCENLIAGSSVFGTGGGLPLDLQRRIFRDLLDQKCDLRIIALEELSITSLVCCAHGIGPAGSFSDSFSFALAHGLNQLEQLCHGKIAAVFPVEVNIESAVYSAIAPIGLPLLDADSTGGRAVPEIIHDNFILADRNVHPVVAVNLSAETKIYREYMPPHDLEREIRRFSKDSPDGIVAVVDHAVSLQEASTLLSTGVITRSIRVGEIINGKLENRVKRQKLAQHLSARELIGGSIDSVSLDRQSGFLVGSYGIKDKSGRIATIRVKNENMIFQMPGVEVSFPTLIAVIDQETLCGVHNSDLKMGQEIIALEIACEDRWKGYSTQHETDLKPPV